MAFYKISREAAEHKGVIILQGDRNPVMREATHSVSLGGPKGSDQIDRRVAGAHDIQSQ